MSKSNQGRVIGYVRVSTSIKDENGNFVQKFDRQLNGVDVDVLFEERASGASKDNRPELQKCLASLEKGDTLVVHEVSRLARSTLDLLDIVQSLISRGVQVKILKENLEFGGKNDSAANKLMLTMLGAIADFERSIIKTRISEGIQAKIAKGEKWGGHHPKAAEKLRELNEKKMEQKVEEEKPHVEIISDLLEKGLKLAEVARKMTSYGLKTSTGRDYNSGSVSRFIARHNIQRTTNRFGGSLQAN